MLTRNEQPVVWAAMRDRPVVNVRDKMSYAAIGRALGISRQVVAAWFNENRRIPAEHVRNVSHVTGIPPHQLRPDLYGAPNVEAAE